MGRRGGFPGGGGGMNMNNLMKQAQKMQRQMEEATKELEDSEVTASAGGGAVEVTVSGKKEITKIKLDEEVVDPDDIDPAYVVPGYLDGARYVINLVNEKLKKLPKNAEAEEAK